jgi:hypothetical protein
MNDRDTDPAADLFNAPRYPFGGALRNQVSWWLTYGPQLLFVLLMLPFLYAAGHILAHVLDDE